MRIADACSRGSVALVALLHSVPEKEPELFHLNMASEAGKVTLFGARQRAPPKLSERRRPEDVAVLLNVLYKLIVTHGLCEAPRVFDERHMNLIDASTACPETAVLPSGSWIQTDNGALSAAVLSHMRQTRCTPNSPMFSPSKR